jgi:hypothetical protein
LGADRRADSGLYSVPLPREAFDFSRQAPLVRPNAFAFGESDTFLAGFGPMVKSFSWCHNIFESSSVHRLLFQKLYSVRPLASL